MAQTSEVILNVKTGNAEKNVGNVTKQIRQYTNELQSLDRGTEEYNSTLQKLADLNSVVYETQQDISAASLNNYQVFQNATSAVSGLVGGFTAFNSVIALAGVENERLTETFVKLQAGVSFVSSLNALSGGVKSFMLLIPRLRTMVAALNATLAANPLGAVLAGITAITVASGLLIRRFSDTETSVNSLKDSFDKFNESLDKSEKAFNDQIELAKAYGAEIDELQQREIDYLNTTSREIQSTIDSLNNKLESLGPSSKFANWFFGNVDIYANRRAEIESEISELTESLTGVNTKLEIAQVTSNRRIEGEEKRAAEERRKIAEKAYQERQRQLESLSKFNQQIVWGIEDQWRDYFRTQEENSKKHFQDIIDEFSQFENLPEVDIPVLDQLYKFTSAEEINKRHEAWEAEIADLTAVTLNTQLSLEERGEAYDKLQSVQTRYNAFRAYSTKELKRLADEEVRIENAKYQIIGGFLTGFSALLGEQTAIGKALAVTNATIDTYRAANAAYASLAGIPIVGPALGKAAAAAAIVSGAANVKRILSAGSSGSISASAPQLPSTNNYIPEISSAMYEPEPTPYVRELQGQEERTINVTTTISEDDIQSSGNRVNINSNEGGLNSQNKRAA